MPVARTEDGSTYAVPDAVSGLIAPARIERVGVPAGLTGLLGLESFDEAQRAAFLAHAGPPPPGAVGWPPPVAQVCWPAMPRHLVEVMDSYGPPHTNPVDEVHHVVDGAVEFGFVTPAGQVLVVVEAGDVLSFPAGTEHWSSLTADRRVKTYVYLSSSASFEHHYTGTTIGFR